MTRFVTSLSIALIIAAVSTVYAQTETAQNDAVTTSGVAEFLKYGPFYRLEVKDQAIGEMFRDLKVVKRFTRRLPNFYNQIVSETQRDKVYEIQAAYFEPMEKLALRLERLAAERDAQIEAVLTAEQKVKIEALAKDAAARRAATRAANAGTTGAN